MNPQDFIPQNQKDLIGASSKICSGALNRIAELKEEKGSRLKIVFRGTPGNGKTSLINIVGSALATHSCDVESLNGRNVTIDKVRDWQTASHYSSLTGGWTVKIINEMDLMPVAAQELMLTYLDELPARFAVIGSSNADCSTLTERFETRFQIVPVESPDAKTIATWLMQKWELPRKAARHISELAEGNVRKACLDAGTFLSFGTLPIKVEKKVAVVTTGSEAALKAWETRRAQAAQ